MLYDINKVFFFINSYYKVISYWDKDNDEMNMLNELYDFFYKLIKIFKI